MYQALYRKWRPRTFDDVVGQSHITETLKNQVRTGRLSHAYLFIGTRGTGKTTCAKILAKAVNCLHPVDGNPCNQCAACRGIDDGSILDVVELDAASNNGVDNVRALREEAVFSPTAVKKRVYIIDEVHMLSVSAFNALLKILEEPPEHLLFILATTELQKVPATILSRCQRHSFRRIAAGQIAGRLRYVAGQESLNLTPDAAALIARLSEGGMRDALSLLDQCAGRAEINADAVLDTMGLAGSAATVALLGDILRQDAEAALRRFDELWNAGKNPAGLLGELAALQRDLLLLKIAPEGGRALCSGGYDESALTTLGRLSGEDQLLSNLDAIQSSLAAMRTAVNPRYCCELCLIGMCRPELSVSPAALLARIERLEQGVALVPQLPAPAETAAAPRTAVNADSRPLRKEAPAVESAKESPTQAPAVENHNAPAAESANYEGDGGALWADMVKALNTPHTLGVYNFIRSPAMTAGILEGDVLNIYSIDPFGLEYIRQTQNQELLRQCAARLLGRPVTLVFREEPPPAPPSPPESGISPLDQLRRFSNVKFE